MIRRQREHVSLLEHRRYLVARTHTSENYSIADAQLLNALPKLLFIRAAANQDQLDFFIADMRHSLYQSPLALLWA